VQLPRQFPQSQVRNGTACNYYDTLLIRAADLLTYPH
jgi:hypothetical protein